MSCTSSGTFMTMDERLEQLLTQAKQHAPHTEGWQLALTQLVKEILRSRKIGRPPIGQPLSGVYQNIYEQLQQQLLQKVGEELGNYNPTRTPVRTWVNILRTHAFRTVLNDVQLKELALEAQRHPPHTELRQHALGELIEAIRLSGRLSHPHRTRFSPQFYELLYEEAVNKTLIYVCRKIDNYDPERGQDKKFMTWVNFRLDRVILDTSREFRDPNISKLPSLTDIEEIFHSDDSPSLVDTVRELIEEDAKNLFKKAHVRNHPEASFQAIASARFSGKSWEEISSQFRISVPTLSSFFQRCCEKFRPEFRKIY
jgi:DNA-directed RNA polymerase specialized sigma24 family protein